MERLYLGTRLRKTDPVDRRQCLPTGECLPSWANVMLCSKFPMIENPKTPAVLHTTRLCQPKYRYNIDYDFDLTDPNGHTLSLEYHPLHDPHLKAHFNSERMRRHLIRNGFITESGMVVCNLQEFNKYRQFLRRICLMELDREKKGKIEQENTLSGMGSKSPRTATRLDSTTDPAVTLNVKSVHDLDYRLKEIRKRNIEKQERNRIRFEMSIQCKDQKFERRKEDLKKRRSEMDRSRKVLSLRRQQVLYQQQKERQERNRSLLKKWRQSARNHQIRLQELHGQRLLSMQQKSRDAWDLRKRVQEERIRKDGEFWDKEEKKKMRNIEERQKAMEDRRKRQYDQLERMKRKARINKEKREARYAKRLAERFAAGDFRVWTSKRAQKQQRKEVAKYPLFKSLWSLETVLAEWLKADSKNLRESKHSIEFLERITETIDDAVDLVMDGEDDRIVKSESERQLRSIAEDYISDLIAHVKDEIYPAYLTLLESDKSEDTFDDYYRVLPQEPKDSEEVLYDEDFCEEDEDGRRKEVHFDERECFIPRDEAFPTGDKLKAVSQHELTPLPSPLHMSERTRKEEAEISFVESLLRRLIEDLNSGKLSRDDLLRLTTYSMEILRRTDIEEKKQAVGAEEQETSDGSDKSSSFIASEIVRFTLGKILDDIKSGSISDEQLTSLTVSIINDRQEPTVMHGGSRIYTNDAMVDKLVIDTLEKALEKPSSAEDLDRLITRTLLEATKIQSVESGDELDILIARTIADAKTARESLTVRSMDTNEELDLLIAKTVANAKSARESIPLQSLDTSEELDLLIAKTITEAKYARESSTKDSLDTNEELDILIAKTIAEATCTKEDLDDESMNEYAIEDFIIHTLERILSDLKEQKLSRHQVLHIASSISTVVEGISSTESKAASDIVRRVLTKILREASVEGIESNAVQKVVSAVVTSYHSIQSVRSSTLLETIESFVYDVLKRIVDMMQQGQLSDSDLNDMSVSFSPKDYGQSRLGRQPIELDSKVSLTKALENNINEVLDDMESGKMSEDKIRHIGKMLFETGGKLMGIDVGQHDLKHIESVTSSDAADHAVNEIFEDIHREWEHHALDKEDVKTLAVSILTSHKSKVTKSDSVKQVTPSSLKLSSPTDSAIAEDLVLRVMDKIKEDVGDGRIPHGALSSIATSVISLIAGGPTTTPGTLGAISSIKSTASDLSEDMKSVLYRITACLKTDNIDFYDAQTIFGIILDRYTTLVVDTSQQHPDHFITAISESTMVENLICETLSKIRRDITIGVQSLHDIVPEDMYSESKEKAESVNSLFLDTLITFTLDQVNKSFKPCDDIYATLSDDSAAVESLIRHTLSKIAGDIEDSDSSTIDTVPSALIEALVRGTLSKMKHDSTSAMAVIKSQSYEQEDAESQTLIPAPVKSPVYGKRDSKKHIESGSLVLSSYTVDFVESIVMQLISSLDCGGIPVESVMHFAKNLVESCELEIVPMEINEIRNVLVQVLLDIRENSANSRYYHRIVCAFSQKASAYGTRDLAAACSILAKIDASVLVQFVRTTLENILIGVQLKKEERSQQDILAHVKATIEARTQNVARQLVDDVIKRVERDFLTAHPDYREQESDMLAVEKMISDTAAISVTKNSLDKVGIPMSQSDIDLESVPSQKIEEFVLMTLHNAISDSLFEQTIVPHEDQSRTTVSSARSSQIYQFVLERLQDIIEDRQHYYIETEVPTSSKAPKRSEASASASTVGSSNLSAYINSILLDSIKDLHVPDTATTDIRGATATASISRVMSSQIDRFVLRTLEGIIIRGGQSEVDLHKSSSQVKVKAITTLTKVKSNMYRQSFMDVSKHILMDSFADLDHGEGIDIFVESLVNAAITQLHTGEVRKDEVVKIRKSHTSEIEVTGQKIMDITSALAAALETDTGTVDTTKSDQVQSWINTVPTASLDLIEVKDVINETLKHTVSNVKEGKLSSEALHTIASALSDKILSRTESSDMRKIISPVESDVIEKYVIDMLEKATQSSADVRDRNIKTFEKIKISMSKENVKIICWNVLLKYFPDLKPGEDMDTLAHSLLDAAILLTRRGKLPTNEPIVLQMSDGQVKMEADNVMNITLSLTRAIGKQISTEMTDQEKTLSHVVSTASQDLNEMKEEITKTLKRTISNLRQETLSAEELRTIASVLSDKLVGKEEALDIYVSLSPVESKMIERCVCEMLENVLELTKDDKEREITTLVAIKSSLHKPEIKDASKRILSETFDEPQSEEDLEVFVESLVNAAIAHVSSSEDERKGLLTIHTSAKNEFEIESEKLLEVTSTLVTAVETELKTSAVGKADQETSVDLTEIKNVLEEILKQTVGGLKRGKFSSQTLRQLSSSLSTSLDRQAESEHAIDSATQSASDQVALCVVTMLEKVINSLVDIRNKTIAKLVKTKANLHRQDVKEASRRIVSGSIDLEQEENTDQFINSLLDVAVNQISGGQVLKDDVVKIRKSPEKEVEMRAQEVIDITSALAKAAEKCIADDETTLDSNRSLIKTEAATSTELTEPKDVVSEALKQTVSLVRDGKLSSESLHVLASSLSKTADSGKTCVDIKRDLSEVDSSLLGEFVVGMLETVMEDVDHQGVSSTSLMNIISHLNESQTRSEVVTDESVHSDQSSASVSSSRIGGLIKDILSNIVEALQEESVTKMRTPTALDSDVLCKEKPQSPLLGCAHLDENRVAGARRSYRNIVVVPMSEDLLHEGGDVSDENWQTSTDNKENNGNETDSSLKSNTAENVRSGDIVSGASGRSKINSNISANALSHVGYKLIRIVDRIPSADRISEVTSSSSIGKRSSNSSVNMSSNAVSVSRKKHQMGTAVPKPNAKCLVPTPPSKPKPLNGKTRVPSRTMTNNKNLSGPARLFKSKIKETPPKPIHSTVQKPATSSKMSLSTENGEFYELQTLSAGRDTHRNGGVDNVEVKSLCGSFTSRVKIRESRL